MTTRTPVNMCGICGYVMNASSHVSDAVLKPTEGDVSVCLNCGAAYIFNADLTLREPTPQENDELAQNDTVVKAQYFIRKRGALPQHRTREAKTNEC